MRWGWAAAVSRTGWLSAPQRAPVDSMDLLAGILLSHPTESPLRAVLDHLGIHPSKVFGARQFLLEDLAAARERIPPDVDPPLTPETQAILASAESAGPFDREELVRLDSLLLNVLRSPTSAAANSIGIAVREAGYGIGAIQEALNAMSLSAVIGTDDPALSSGSAKSGSADATQPGLAEHLERLLPRNRRAVLLPRFSHDDPRSAGADLVDIAAEVNAFANLLASTTIEPPLAVGLFGEWGAGKSYFMSSIRHRIVEITERSDVKDRRQHETTFYKQIIQVEFNAWQYVGGNLWASLINHLFTELAGRKTPGVFDAARGSIEHELESVKATSTALEERKTTAQTKVNELKQSLEDAREKRDSDLQALRDAQGRNPLVGLKLHDTTIITIQKAAAKAGVLTIATEAVELVSALDAARTTLLRTPSVLAPLRVRGKVRWRYTIALVAVIGLVPLLALIANTKDWSTLSAISSQAATFLAGIAAVVRFSNGRAVAVLVELEKARRALDSELDERRKTLDAEVETARTELRKADGHLAELEADSIVAKTTVAATQQRLDALTPTSVLSGLIGERADSDDYRRHLGLPAVIRRDLESLSEAVATQNKALKSCDDQLDIGEVEKRVNRIVLYIDDLDRCPITKVIEVLQAVHLLLAFPLFVVVVAVDMRWLESALRSHYSRLLQQDTSLPMSTLREGRATALDYVEKIFQVPFWVQPLGPTARRNVIRGLVAPALVADRDDEAPIARASEPQPLSAGLGDLQAWLQRPVVGDPQVAAQSLSMVTRELAFMEEVGALLGSTPRSLKRFVNVYLLVKAIALSEGGGDKFLAREDHAPYQVVIVLLALSTGLRDVAAQLFLAIDDPPPNWKLKMAAPPDSVLEHWLTAGHGTWGDLDADALRPWAEHARRFSFLWKPAHAP